MSHTEAKQSNAPTPWEATGPTVYAATNHGVVAYCHTGRGFTSEYHANAAHIVHCVNNHESLVAALEGMLECYTSLVNSGDAGNWNPETDDEVVAARAALKQAKEVQP